MNRPGRTLAFGVSLALAIGCKGAETKGEVVTRTEAGKASASPAGTEVAKRDRSLVRLVNAIPGGRHLEVGGDDRTVFADVAYKTVTPYVELKGNAVKFHLRNAGVDSILATNSEMLMDGYRYTLIAMRDKAAGVRLVALRDEVVPDSGKARIRVINAAMGADDADVAVQGQKDPLFENVAYGAEAGNKDIVPMTATIEIRRDKKAGATILLKNMRFDAGRAYTIVLTGAKPSEIDVITFDDAVAPSGLAAGVH